LVKTGHPIDDKTVKKLWQQSPVACQGHLSLWDYHRHPDRYQARLQVIQLYYQGWEKVSISRFLQVSRPTVDVWIRRFEAEHFAGLVDKSRAPQTPIRKIWLPLMVQVYHLQKAHPDAGEFRIWSLLARSDVSVRTIGRVMALNRLVYDDIPHVPKRGVQPAPGLHPYKAAHRHQYWFIDGRRMDFAIDGVHWWSLIILEGYPRTMPPSIGFSGGRPLPFAIPLKLPNWSRTKICGKTLEFRVHLPPHLPCARQPSTLTS
jgi:hypothetical protein